MDSGTNNLRENSVGEKGREGACVWWRRGRRPWCLRRGGRWLASGELAYSTLRHSCSYSSGTHLVTHTTWPTHPPSAPPRAALTPAPPTSSPPPGSPAPARGRSVASDAKNAPEVGLKSVSVEAPQQRTLTPEGHALILSSVLCWRLT